MTGTVLHLRFLGMVSYAMKRLQIHWCHDTSSWWCTDSTFEKAPGWAVFQVISLWSISLWTCLQLAAWKVVVWKFPFPTLLFTLTSDVMSNILDFRVVFHNSMCCKVFSIRTSPSWWFWNCLKTKHVLCPYYLPLTQDWHKGFHLLIKAGLLTSKQAVFSNIPTTSVYFLICYLHAQRFWLKAATKENI